MHPLGEARVLRIKMVCVEIMWCYGRDNVKCLSIKSLTANLCRELKYNPRTWYLATEGAKKHYQNSEVL